MIRSQTSVHWRCYVAGSDAWVTGYDENALLRPWRKKRSEAEPEDLSGKPGPFQPLDRASAEPAASPVQATHAEFIAALAGHPPRPIPLEADALDLEDRVDHLNRVFGALSVYLAVVLDDTAQNVPGGLDFPCIEAVLADLASDVTGAIQYAADGMAGRIA
jgi:hypothetical protein